MKWLAFVALIFAAPALAQTASAPAGPTTAMTPSPDDRAKQWLTLVDDGNYADAYKQLSAAAQTKIAAGAWTQKIGQTRAPLGAMASRTIHDVKLTKTRAGMGDGQDAIVRFDSSFAHRASAIETVALTSEKGGWSVTSYSVN